MKSEEGDGVGSAGDDGEEWNFIFSPEQVDAEIGLDQFQKIYLYVEDMQTRGIEASMIRQDLLNRAKEIENAMQE